MNGDTKGYFRLDVMVSENVCFSVWSKREEEEEESEKCRKRERLMWAGQHAKR